MTTKIPEQPAHVLSAADAKSAEAFADYCWGELIEKDDRNSPEEYPDMVLVTFDEIKDHIIQAMLHVRLLSNAETRQNDSGECQPPEVFSEPPSTLSESAGASGLLPCPFCGSPAFKYTSGNASGIIEIISCRYCPTQFQGKSEAEIVKVWNTRAAPVQAEPVAWHYLRATARTTSGEPALWQNELTFSKPDTHEFIKDVRPLVYASPPTPVLGEAHRDAIIRSATALCEHTGLFINGFNADTNLYSNEQREDWRNQAIAAAECVVRAYLTATPVSAGLDDMGKQNGSEKL